MSQIYKSVASSPSVATSFVTDLGTVVPAGNIVNVNGGNGVTVSANPNGSNNMVITVVSDGFFWSEKAIGFNAAVQNGYFCTASLTAVLPAGSSLGNTVIFYIDTASAVTIQAQAGDFIQVGSGISVSGGVAVSNAQGAILELVYRPSDTTWHTISSLGVWSVT